MTIKHIRDQIENYALEVARKAYLKGLEDSTKIRGGETTNNDEVNDSLLEIVKTELKGE